ncbi:5962_t:CDS:2 [Diversispora eburnea]|uniref:5962_t:CDS:1 n=1 Tax=Diversispora eburnea TaxID=1213867 RepID=A0A9N9ASE2_9GLOM|nr:5962_t:CDS:2 [Diversispora eburnea]
MSPNFIGNFLITGVVDDETIKVGECDDGGAFVETNKVVVLERLTFECIPFFIVVIDVGGGEIDGVFTGGLDGGVVENGGDWVPIITFFEFISNLNDPVNCGNNKLEFENCVSVGDVVFIEGGHMELEGIVIDGVLDDNCGENLSRTGGCH